MADLEIPGYMEYVTNGDRWIDYIFKSKLSPQHKLVAVVIARSAVYNRHKYRQESILSLYSITRIVNLNQDEVETLIQEMIALGWLFDTEKKYATNRVFCLTFSLIPLGDMKK